LYKFALGPTGAGGWKEVNLRCIAMSDSKIVRNSILPSWASDPFYDFLEHQQDLARTLRMSMNGISMLIARHGVIEILQQGKTDDDLEVLEKAARERDLAQSEVDNDFPILHEHATVALWGSLEALVLSFAASWLENKAGAGQVEAVKKQKLKIKLGDYESIAAADRCLWVIELIDRETSGPLKNGVNRFENLLQAFRLNGTTLEELKKTLFEMSQLRHAIVHRRGRADRKLIEACPWLSLKSGDRIKITHKMWRTYSDAAVEYVSELIQRVRIDFGLGRFDTDAKNESDIGTAAKPCDHW
jgi:hypothetical protein